jgi:hypothetical protein
MWTAGDGALFTVAVDDRTVLDRGTFRRRQALNSREGGAQPG